MLIDRRLTPQALLVEENSHEDARGMHSHFNRGDANAVINLLDLASVTPAFFDTAAKEKLIKQFCLEQIDSFTPGQNVLFVVDAEPRKDLSQNSSMGDVLWELALDHSLIPQALLVAQFGCNDGIKRYHVDMNMLLHYPGKGIVFALDSTSLQIADERTTKQERDKACYEILTKLLATGKKILFAPEGENGQFALKKWKDYCASIYTDDTMPTNLYYTNKQFYTSLEEEG